MRTTNASALLFAVAVLAAGSARAQATRTWVSGVGDDANPCSRTAPCKTFAGTISKTASGGEINVLDPAGLGAVTITKPITIDGRGTLSSILASGTNGVIIRPAPGQPALPFVTLRGLTINGAGTGLTGIKIEGATQVNIEDCHIFGFTQNAIDFAGAGATAPAKLSLRNTNINSAAGIGVRAVDGRVILDRVSVLNSNVGVDASSGAQVVVNDSVISGHTTDGVHTADTAVVTLERSTVANNAVGLHAEGTIRISDTTLSLNATGLSGNVVSFGNNRLAAGNTTPGTPSSVIQQQ